jgi:hypothetical protein
LKAWRITYSRIYVWRRDPLARHIEGTNPPGITEAMGFILLEGRHSSLWRSNEQACKTVPNELVMTIDRFDAQIPSPARP